MFNKTFFESDKKPILVLALFCIILYFINIGGWDLWAPDEPKFGQITREMLQKNDWFVLHINQQPYTRKPPMFFWLSGIFSLIAGNVTSITMRLPSAFTGVGGVIVTYFIAKKLFNRRVAFLSSLVLATTATYFWQARCAQTDMLLSFFIFLSILCFINIYKNIGNKTLNAYLFWVFMALATLSKGPVGIIIPLGSIITFLIVNKEKQKIKELKIFSGLILYLILLLIWLMPVFLQAEKTNVKDLLWIQNIIRYLNPDQHNQPVYYFIKNLPPGFMLWFFFLPSAFILGFKSKNSPYYINFKFNLCWFFFTFVFFSLSPGKRDQYILPMYPALAMMVGYLFYTYIFEEKRFDKKLSIPMIVFISVIVLITGLFMKLILNLFEEKTETTITFIKPITLYLPLIILAFLILFFLLTKSAKTIFYGITIISFVSMLLAVLFISPIINRYKSTRELCTLVDNLRGQDESIGIYKIFRAEYMFYGNYYLDELNELENLKDYFNTDKKRFCIFRKSNFEELTEGNKDIKLYVYYDKQVGSRGIILAGNCSPECPPLIQEHLPKP